jgi:maltoporin
MMTLKTIPATVSSRRIRWMVLLTMASFGAVVRPAHAGDSAAAASKSAPQPSSAPVAAKPEQADQGQRMAALEASVAALQAQTKTLHLDLLADQAERERLATETRERFQSYGWNPAAGLSPESMPYEFHGYLRSGYGLSPEGRQQIAFQAPGALAKYRLGNENETYGEFALVNKWLSAADGAGPEVRSQVRLSFKTHSQGTYDSLTVADSDVALREAFIEIGKVIPSTPGVTFWAGQRYYQRNDIHINDFYYLDMSGYGAGVTGIPVGSATLDVAYLAANTPTAADGAGGGTETNIDLRLNGQGLGGRWMLWLNGALSGHERQADGEISSRVGGVAGGVQLQHDHGDSFNKLMLMAGKGASANFAVATTPDSLFVSDEWRLRAVDTAVIDAASNLSLQIAGVADYSSPGQGLGDKTLWLSGGARGVLFFNDYFSLATEAGVDFVDGGPAHAHDALGKFTIAPQVASGRHFFSRPVIRLFATYAQWGDGFRGYVGGDALATQNWGVSFGVQGESWW